MSLHGLLLFCTVYLLATASPGPGIAAILARAMNRGGEGMAAFIAGFVAGDLVWLTFAATGMAVLAQTAHAVFVVIKYVGAAYLLYLAWRLWTAPAEPVGAVGYQPPQSGMKLFLGGLSLTLGNPKVMVFFMALLPTVVDLAKLGPQDFLKLAVAICLILSGVLSGYSLAALRARRFFRSTRAVRWLNRGTGTVLAGAAVAVATR